MSGRSVERTIIHAKQRNFLLLSCKHRGVRETEILVEQQLPQGIFVCDHAVLVINQFSPRGGSEVHQVDRHDQKCAAVPRRARM